MKKSFLLCLKLLSTTMLVTFSFACIFAQVVVEEEVDKAQWEEEVPLELYKPMPMPEWTPPTSFSPDPESFITYDPVTRQEITGPMSPELQQAFGLVPGSKGVDTLNMSMEPFAADNFGSLTQITSPEVYPWRVNCKLYMTFTDGGGSPHYYVGSCILIDPMHALTAGHCVYNKENNWGWATSITVRPGYESGISPYGYANETSLHSWTGWTVNYDYDHDMGVIDLDRPVGALTGWHGYGYNNNNSFFTGNTFHNAQYPAQSPYTGELMYYWYGNYDNAYTYIVYFNQYSYGGQSGSGAYFLNTSDDRHVYAEQSHRQWTGSYWRSGQPRITSNKFGHIGGWISDDTPATFDFIPLDANASPASIATGQSLSVFNYLVHNYSSASRSGNVDVDVYLSTNNIISTFDDLIQAHTFNWAFTSKSSVRVNATGPMIPWTKPAGSYYIGVILDISDYNTGNNNSSTQDVAPLTITEGSLPIPGGFYATNGTYTGYVFVDWNTVSGATHYKVYRSTTNSPGSATDISGWTTNSYFYDYPTPGTLYYYWVKAAANSSGYASSPFSSSNYGWRKISAPTSLYASDGTYTGYVHTSWNYASGGNFYQLYRSTSNVVGTASAISGWTANNYYDDSGATPGVTYYYWVKAAATSGGARQSDFSSVNSGWRKLSPPSGFSATSGVYNDHVHVNWSAATGASHYNLYRNTVNNSGTASSVSGWTTNTFFNDYGVNPNQTYYYWVKSSRSAAGWRLSSFSGYTTGHAGVLDCSSANPLFCGTAFNGNTNTGVNNVANYGCNTFWVESGPEVVHEIFVYNTGTLTAALSNLGGVDLDVFILGSCNNNDCLAYGDWSASYASATPGLYYIAVDGFQGSAGSYTLTVTCPPVPTNKAVQSVTLYNGWYMCYDATNTITVAGSLAVPFVVQNGGDADFKAGTNIRFLDGTHIMAGGHMHAQITTTFCGWAPAPLVASNNPGIEEKGKLPEKTLEAGAESEFFNVYPNPTTGRLTIEFNRAGNDEKTYVQIVNLLGNIILYELANNANLFEVDLSEYSPGIYIIRVIQGDKAESKKIIKQ